MRSKYKLPYFGNLLWQLFYNKNLTSNDLKVYTKNRKITLNMLFSWIIFYVYNGKTFYQVRISENMSNTKIGEFSITKKKCVYKSTKKRGGKSKKKFKKKNQKKKKK